MGDAVIVGGLRRLDVVEEAAVFVVGDDQQRLRPRWALHDGIKQLQHQFLACVEVGGWVVVVGAGRAEGEVVEVRVDPGDGWEVAFGGVLQEAGVSEDVVAGEVGGDGLVAEPVFGIDQPEHRHVVVGVPTPRGLRVGVVQVADERGEVPGLARLEVVAMTVRGAGGGVAAVRHGGAPDGAKPAVADRELLG